MRQHEVWHGARVSAAAVRPPEPQRLASPTAFLHLETTEEAPVMLSNRDWKCFYDQLRFPSRVQPWMTRPAVKVGEFARALNPSRPELGCLV